MRLGSRGRLSDRRALVELPFELVVVSEGDPAHDRAAFERALELPPHEERTLRQAPSSRRATADTDRSRGCHSGAGLVRREDATAEVRPDVGAA